jgi:hypothetical protein
MKERQKERKGKGSEEGRREKNDTIQNSSVHHKITKAS